MGVLPSPGVRGTRELQEVIDAIVAAVKAGDDDRAKELDLVFRERQREYPMLQANWRA